MVKKASITLADGRELIYFGDHADQAAGYPDLRPLPRVEVSSQVRYDPLLGEWVIVAGHRQDRTFLPPADHCPLDPSSPGRLTEIPAPSYQVVVFENRFPSLVPGGGAGEGGGVVAGGGAGEGGGVVAGGGAGEGGGVVAGGGAGEGDGMVAGGGAGKGEAWSPGAAPGKGEAWSPGAARGRAEAPGAARGRAEASAPGAAPVRGPGRGRTACSRPGPATAGARWSASARTTTPRSPT